MKIIAFITDGPTVRDLLGHLGEPIAPPRIAPASLPARGHPGDRTHPEAPPPARGAAPRRRKSTFTPHHRPDHNQARATEMAIHR
jgi:hypothetical protein